MKAFALGFGSATVIYLTLDYVTYRILKRQYRL